MMSKNDQIVKWAVDKITEEYSQDVSMLVIYGSYENGTANPMSDVDFYFIPKTDRAYELCKTFIVEEVGYDLFPMSWDRVAGLAEMKESLTPLLANVKIAYCGSDEDKVRFEGLQEKLHKHLNDQEFMMNKAKEKLEEARDSFRDMAFDEDLCDIKTKAGFIAICLSDAVAYANQTYFSRGLKMHLEDLKGMAYIPEKFLETYETIIREVSADAIKLNCYRMIKSTKHFLEEKTHAKLQKKEPHFDGLAELYQEIVSTWNKIYMYCDEGNVNLAYVSGVCLQAVLDETTEEHGLNKINLMGFFDANNLKQFKKRAQILQKKVVDIIEKNNAQINQYRTVEDFLKSN